MLVVLASAVVSAQPPTAEISNKAIRATFQLPDPDRGYYRGTRFDWSGVISSLKYAGHEYFGVWFEKYDPKIHDAITGPVEEYRTNEAGLGYDEAKPGEMFVRIGVGVVRKPNETEYQLYSTYDIIDPGKWITRPSKDRIEFVHELRGPNGYAYRYTKIVRLVGDKPRMEIEHRLKNTGTKPIDTAQYNHNFFVIDRTPTGPDMTVLFPFDATPDRDLKGMARIEGRELKYPAEVPPGRSMLAELKGFGAKADDYDFRIENRKTKAGVRIRGDRPLVKLVFWCIRTTLCPEPYINIHVAPGQEEKWKIAYDFYTLK